jgi:hypothetical protein
MICADFLAGAHLENGNPKVLLFSMLRLFRLPPAAEDSLKHSKPQNRQTYFSATRSFWKSLLSTAR